MKAKPFATGVFIAQPLVASSSLTSKQIFVAWIAYKRFKQTRTLRAYVTWIAYKRFKQTRIACICRQNTCVECGRAEGSSVPINPFGHRRRCYVCTNKNVCLQVFMQKTVRRLECAGNLCFLFFKQRTLGRQLIE